MAEIYQVASIRDLLGCLNPDEPMYLDTETAQYYSDVRLVQLYQESWPQALVFDTKSGSSINVIWEIIKDQHLVLQNGLYDWYSIKADVGPEFTVPTKWSDTFYLARLVFPSWGSGNYSLDKCLTKVLGYDPYEKAGLHKKTMQASYERLKVKDQYVMGPDGLRDLTHAQYLYGAIDVYKLPHLYNQVKHLEDDAVYQLDKLTAESVVTDTLGLPVDEANLDKLEATDVKLIAGIDKQLPQGFNVNSYQQVRTLLGTVVNSDETALSIIMNRPTGLTGVKFRQKATHGKFPAAVVKGLIAQTITGYSVSFGESIKLDLGSEAIVQNQLTKLAGPKGASLEVVETNYVHTDKVMQYSKLINDKRKALKRLNFVDRARKAMKYDEKGVPRIMGHFSPHAINGRIQVDNENLSQYPRTMKSMWGHKPGVGRKLIYSDFAQVELRIICAALPEMNMYKSLQEGIDLHTFVGNNLNLSPEAMADLPDGISPRFIAKQCNFLLLYGGGKNNFQRTVCKLGGIWFEDQLNSDICDNWKDIFSDIKSWHARNSKSKTNMDTTVLGRQYKADTVTDLNNIKVSGTGSEIFKLWLHYVRKYILLLVDDIYIVNRVHDSIILDVPDIPEVYEAVSRNVAKAAQSAWFEIIQYAALTDVPMPVDVLVGNNWEDLEYGKNIDYEYTLDGMYMYSKELEEELE